MTGRAYGFVDGDDYVAIVTEGAPRGRLVRVPLRDRPRPHHVGRGAYRSPTRCS